LLELLQINKNILSTVL